MSGRINGDPDAIRALGRSIIEACTDTGNGLARIQQRLEEMADRGEWADGHQAEKYEAFRELKRGIDDKVHDLLMLAREINLLGDRYEDLSS